MTPKVSVVIPTYNRAAKVAHAVESVLSQTFRDLEVIVVDDGSTDDTGAVLTSCFGDRIRYCPQKNQGASAARNKGIEQARGEWIAFLDSDDRWEADKLEWQLRATESFGTAARACYTDVRFYNYDEPRTMFQLGEESYVHQGEMGLNPEALRLLVRPGGAGMVICLSSFMVHSEVVRASGGFDPKLPYSQDSDFMFRLAMHTEFTFVNRPLVWFDRSPVELRHVGVSAEWNKFDVFLRDSQMRLEGLTRFSDRMPPAVSQLIREQLASIYSGWTNWYLEAGDHGNARFAISRALQMDPNIRYATKWLLTWLRPTLALKAVRRNQERNKTFSV